METRVKKGEKYLAGFWDKPLQDLLQLLQATPAGLTDSEAKQRLRLYGPNSMAQESRFAGLLAFLRFFANPLVIILVVVLLSVLLNFFMEFQARHAVEAIRKQVAITAAVMRDGREQELPIAE